MLRFTKIACSIAVLTATSAFADLNTGLMAKYTFDDCNASDTSGNNNTGTIIGTALCKDGIIGQAMHFDGSTYIKVKDAPSLRPNDQLTISFWIKADSLQNLWSAIIYKGIDNNCAENRSYTIWLNKDQHFHQASAGDNTCQHTLDSKKTNVLTSWVHYVGVIDRKNHLMQIYINGKLSSSVSDNFSSFNNNTYDLKIGYSENQLSWESPFTGLLDEVRLYNRTLSFAEINTLYNEGASINGIINSFGVHTVTCTNNTTSQTITIPASRKKNFDCEIAGLIVSPKDKVSITINGDAE
jgi:hypothetical protein